MDFLDINFLSGNKSKKADGKGLRHSQSSIWNNFSDFAGAIIRISIYIASAILLMSLIWYGINIVRHTLDNPRGRADAIAGLARLRNALGILIGTILFMAVCIFGSKAFCDAIKSEDSYELPIRVNVEDTYRRTIAKIYIYIYIYNFSNCKSFSNIINDSKNVYIMGIINNRSNYSSVLCIWKTRTNEF